MFNVSKVFVETDSGRIGSQLRYWSGTRQLTMKRYQIKRHKDEEAEQ